MAYDPRRGRTVMFGGTARDPGGSVYNLFDTWEWDGLRWYFRGTNGPAWRTLAAMTYNNHTETVLLGTGGHSSSDPFPHAYWEWNGAAWKTNGVCLRTAL